MIKVEQSHSIEWEATLDADRFEEWLLNSKVDIGYHLSLEASVDPLPHVEPVETFLQRVRTWYKLVSAYAEDYAELEQHLLVDEHAAHMNGNGCGFFDEVNHHLVGKLDSLTVTIPHSEIERVALLYSDIASTKEMLEKLDSRSVK